MVLNFVLPLFVSILASFIVVDVLGRAPAYSQRLLRTAVRRLPRKLRDRYYEEWSAELTHAPSAISEIVFAAGLNVAAWRIYGSERRRVAAKRMRAEEDIDWVIASIAVRSAKNARIEFSSSPSIVKWTYGPFRYVFRLMSGSTELSRVLIPLGPIEGTRHWRAALTLLLRQLARRSASRKAVNNTKPR